MREVYRTAGGCGKQAAGLVYVMTRSARPDHAVANQGVTAWVYPDEKAALNKLAAALRLSASEIARRAITEWIARHQPKRRDGSAT
jgi:hypothetical protein